MNKPLIDIYCQIDVPGDNNLLHNLDIKLSIKLNEEIGFSL
ncbi:hypothetical protein YPPY103_2721, partial [Yersinia pestis PY-103]